MKSLLHRRCLKGFGLIAIAFILFIAINIIGRTALSSWRIDLTEENLYTLSDGTKELLAALDEPITLRFFYAEEQAAGITDVQGYAARIRSLLKQYASHAGDNIQLEFIDPEPFSAEEDMAVAFGMKSFAINQAGDKLYFGLAASNSVDQTETIPFFESGREAFLEYDLTRMIDTLAHPDKPTIGLMSWLPMQQGTPAFMGGSGPWVIYQQMQQHFSVQPVAKDTTRIPDEVDVLIVAHPTDITPDTEYAIDQFILRGGRALIFVDSHSDIKSDPGQQGPTSSSLPTLFDRWGVELIPGKIAADREHALTINVAGNNNTSRLDMLPYVVWMEVPKENLNADDIVTAELDRLRVISGGILQHKKEAEGTVAFTPLISTGTDSMAVDQMTVRFSPNPAELLQHYQSRGEPLTLAARLQGKAQTAFPDRQDNGHISESDKDINVIIMADTDMLENAYWIRQQALFGKNLMIPTADNGAFVLNALENLSGSSELIALRSRGNATRPFTVVEELRRQAEERFRQEEIVLQQRLQETEQKLMQLQQSHSEDSAFIFSPQQQQALEEFREEMVATRKQLRQVQHSLRQEIDTLGSWLKFINIALMPFLVLALAVWVPRWLGVKRR